MSIRWVLVGTMVLCACGDDGRSSGDAGVDADPYQTVIEAPVAVNRSLDVLWVIDDSPGMADKQTNLAANFPNFVNILSTAPGGLPEVHFGVVTTDLGTRGSDGGTPGPAIGQIGNGGCSGTGKSGTLQTSGASVTGNYISDLKQTDGSRVKNYTGSLDAVFAQMARPGAGGCGFEQPFNAMRAALNNNPQNAGFVRPDAMLAVIFVTDEDDCTFKAPTFLGSDPALGPLDSFRCTRFGVTCANGGKTPDDMNVDGAKSGCVASTGSERMPDMTVFRDFLLSLKTDPRKLVVAGIMGTTTPVSVELRSPPGGGSPTPALAHSCTYPGAAGPEEVADPPARLASLLRAFPEANAQATICQRDLSGSLTSIAHLLLRKLGNPCLVTALADQDPNQPGTQVDCFVDDVVGSRVTPIAACDANLTPPCWRFVTDLMSCPLADHLKLSVQRAMAPDPATITRMRCLVP